MSTDVRTLLHDLAAEAPRGRGEETADLVVDLHRDQDRRRLRWAGVAAAIAVVVAVVPALVDRSGSVDTSDVASGGTAEVASLFEAPTRGSLADDADAVQAAQAARWDTGFPDNAGDILDPAPEDRHVAFVGDVPGGQVWALVLGNTSGQLAFGWFRLADPQDVATFELSVAPARTMPGVPLALIDSAGDHGPMVVVTQPGSDVVLDVPAGGDLPRQTLSLVVDDGLAIADIETPDDVGPPGFRTSSATGLRWPVQFDSSDVVDSPAVTSALLGVLADPTISDRATDCLVDRGWVTRVGGGGIEIRRPFAHDDTVGFLAAIDACSVEARAAAAASGEPDD